MFQFRRFVDDERGATAIEYGVIAAILAVALVAAVPLLASSVDGLFESVASAVEAAIG